MLHVCLYATPVLNVFTPPHKELTTMTDAQTPVVVKYARGNVVEGLAAGVLYTVAITPDTCMVKDVDGKAAYVIIQEGHDLDQGEVITQVTLEDNEQFVLRGLPEVISPCKYTRGDLIHCLPSGRLLDVLITPFEGSVVDDSGVLAYVCNEHGQGMDQAEVISQAIIEDSALYELGIDFDQTAEPTQKYSQGDTVLHHKGQKYTIHLTPAEHIEIVHGEPAYAYARHMEHVGPDNKVWLRSQTDVEDETKFTLVLPEVVVPPTPAELVEHHAKMAARGALEEEIRIELNNKVQELVGVITDDSDVDAIFQGLQTGIEAFVAERYTEVWETQVGQVWALPHAARGGIPVQFLHRAEGYDFEASTLFVVPQLKETGPAMIQVGEVTTHQVDDSPTNLTISVMHPDNAPEGMVDKVYHYDIQGFTTLGLGGRPSRPGIPLVFQCGNPGTYGVNGLTMEALLAVCSHRLGEFQKTAFACEENATALNFIDHALSALNLRTATRIAAGEVSKPIEGMPQES